MMILCHTILHMEAIYFATSLQMIFLVNFYKNATTTIFYPILWLNFSLSLSSCAQLNVYCNKKKNVLFI